MINWNDYDWEVLNRMKHNIRDFSSGYRVFDEHLYIDSIIEQAYGLSQTRVLTNGEEVIAYYTAKCTKIEIGENELQEIGAKDKSVPAIEISMLAVDQRFLKHGIGSETLGEILSRAHLISQNAGCRYVFLRAVKEPWLIAWYKSYAFKEIPFEVVDDFTQPMSYKLPTLQELSESEFHDLF